MVRILLADDHPIVRDGLSAVLELQPDVEVVGEAGDGPTAVTLARELKPDVVLMDLQLPGFSGAEATRQILAETPDIRILILTAYDSDEGILEAVRAGASGYLLKGAVRSELVQAIRVVASGGSLLQPSLVARLLAKRTPEGTHEALSERELEVLKLVVDGLRNKEIADVLGIAERTVKFHTGIIFQKLGVTSRTEAAAAALKQGLVK
jgi:DNA-binding NarL/FixJ family response regulator